MTSKNLLSKIASKEALRLSLRHPAKPPPSVNFTEKSF